MIDVRAPASPRHHPDRPLAARRGVRRGRARRRITSPASDTRVAVIGLGYVGLPLALAFAEAGLAVEGIDVSAARVAGVARGASPIDDVPDSRISSALARGLRIATLPAARLGEADGIVVCVPTPVTDGNEPDLGPVLLAATSIAEDLRPGQLVILQSTSFPGTTNGPFREALEAGSGLRAGSDFDLAFAPERVNPGDPSSAERTVPRLVGGTTPGATRRSVRLLERINDQVVAMSSPDAAELAKLLENTFRHLNIALVNQLAVLCERMGLDVWEVVDGAATKPFGFMRFTPGPGVGGHCIPVDPHYLAARARSFGLSTPLIEAADAINAAMPGHVVDLVARTLAERAWPIEGARVGVLGVAFKPNVRDARNAPSGEIVAGLARRGAEVRYHDPHVWAFRDASGEERLSSELSELLRWADVVVAVTAHAAIDWDAVYRDAEQVVDAVGTSRGRTLRSGQVRRLGSGQEGSS